MATVLTTLLMPRAPPWAPECLLLTCDRTHLGTLLLPPHASIYLFVSRIHILFFFLFSFSSTVSACSRRCFRRSDLVIPMVPMPRQKAVATGMARFVSVVRMSRTWLMVVVDPRNHHHRPMHKKNLYYYHQRHQLLTR